MRGNRDDIPIIYPGFTEFPDGEIVVLEFICGFAIDQDLAVPGLNGYFRIFISLALDDDFFGRTRLHLLILVDILVLGVRSTIEQKKACCHGGNFENVWFHCYKFYRLRIYLREASYFKYRKIYEIRKISEINSLN